MLCLATPKGDLTVGLSIRRPVGSEPALNHSGILASRLLLQRDKVTHYVLEKTSPFGMPRVEEIRISFNEQSEEPSAGKR